MVKSIPGWLNFALLWLIYFGLGLALKAITGFKCDVKFIALFTTFYCGAYLAKWQFHDGDWHFW